MAFNQRNYSSPWRLGSGTGGLEDGAEGAAACEGRGIDDGADDGLALGGPHRAVAVDHLPLDDGRARKPLATVVCRLDRTGMGEEDEELIVSPADLGLEGSGQLAATLPGEDGPELSVEAPALGGERRGGELRAALGQGAYRLQLELQPPGHGVIAGLDDVGDVAGEMGEVGLVAW